MDLGLGREIFVSSEESSFPQAGAASLSQWLWRDLREKLSAFFLFFFLGFEIHFFSFFFKPSLPAAALGLGLAGVFPCAGRSR